MRCLRATCYLNLFFVSLLSPDGGDGFLNPDIPVLVRNPFFWPCGLWTCFRCGFLTGRVLWSPAGTVERFCRCVLFVAVRAIVFDIGRAFVAAFDCCVGRDGVRCGVVLVLAALSSLLVI